MWFNFTCVSFLLWFLLHFLEFVTQRDLTVEYEIALRVRFIFPLVLGLLVLGQDRKGILKSCNKGIAGGFKVLIKGVYIF